MTEELLPTDAPPAKPASRRGETPVISVRNLSKMYKVYDRPSTVLREILMRKPMYQEHWALRDISFDIQEGEILGILGPNGAGKSTLLKLVAGVLDRTSGTVDVRGRLRAILEIGTGFHKERSGYENIFLGGFCLGYSKREIRKQVDWIIDYAELQQAIHRPLRTYSKGMRARLSFAVTFCIMPRIMIIDEALAAGDAAFKQKCMNRIAEFCSSGATAIVVSHSLGLVERLCTRCLYIRDGRIIDDGEVLDVIKHYEHDSLGDQAQRDEHLGRLESGAGEDDPDGADQPPAELDDDAIRTLVADADNKRPAIVHLGIVKLTGARTLNDAGEPETEFRIGDTVVLEFDIESRIDLEGAVAGARVFDRGGTVLISTTNIAHLDAKGQPQAVPLTLTRGRQTFRVRLPNLRLGNDNYTVGLGISPRPGTISSSRRLLYERRCMTFGVIRPDSSRHVTYEAVAEWEC